MPVLFFYTNRSAFEEGTGRTGDQNSMFHRLILADSLLQKEPAESCYSTNVDRFHISIVESNIDASEFFFFKFSYAQGAEEVLRNRPWMIRATSIYLNKWSPSVSLTKEELSKVPVWIKFHDVSLVAYTMGHNIYVRAMIEIDAHQEIIDTLVVVVPKLNDIGYIRVTICIKYEWKLPRWYLCGVWTYIG
nr:hypothetical protein [Tanacetum cinerariifolium]